MRAPVLAPRREIRRAIRQPVTFLLAFALAATGNLIAVRLFVGFDFYFGTIFSLLLLLRIGPVSAILGALLGALPVAFTNTAVWVPLFAVAEVLFLALMPARRKAEYLVPLDALFWLLAGVLTLFVLFPLSGSFEEPLIFVLNRFINGAANAVAATILHTLVVEERRAAASRKHRFSYRSVIFIAMIAFVLIPSLFILVTTINREVDLLERRIAERTDLVLKASDQSVALRLRDYEHAVRTVARAAELEGSLTGDPLAMELRFLYQADRWVRFAGIWDEEGGLLLSHGDSESVESLGTYAITEVRNEEMPFALVRLESEDPAETMSHFGILILVPILSDGERIGDVGMVVDARLVGHLLADLSEGWWIKTAILDGENRVIGSSSPGVEALEVLREEMIPGNEGGLPSKVALLVAGTAWGKPGTERLYEESRPFSYKPTWRLVADTSLAPYRTEMQREALRSLMIVTAVLITAMGLAALVSATLVRSLGKLHKMTDTFPGSLEEEEEEERAWPSSRIKEISNLIRRFRGNISAMSEAFQELRRANTNLAEARDAAKAASRAKSAFLANVSHELRTPLNAILGYAQFLQAEESLSDEYREPVSTIRGSAEQLLEMIDDILEVSRLRNRSIVEKWDVFDLRSLLEHIARPFTLEAEASGLEVEVDFDSSLPHFVRADQKHLRRILTNLLDNAIKFTEKGSVRFAATMATPERLQVTVEDTGVGISEEHLSEIFAPFHQQEEPLTKRRSGTGLGLAIVQHLVTLMQGTIQARSVPGKGTTFTVELPLAVVTSGEVSADLQGAGVPRPEYARALLQVAESGDVTHLRSLLEELREQDRGAYRFYEQALALVDAFELDRLKELLRRQSNG
ncbi:MAG: sensor histidine kinase [Spirochaetaceae bacterium]